MPDITDDRYRLIRNRDYMLLMTGQTISQIGSVMGSFAFLLLTFAVTGSPSQSGVVSAAFVFGVVLALLPAGAVADRRDRKKVMIASSAIGALLYVSVVVAYSAGVLTLAQLVVVALAEGVVTALFRPAEQAALPQLVEQRDLGTALAANSGRTSLASLLGAPLAGLLFGIGRTIPLIADAVSFLVSCVCISLIKRPLRAAEVTELEPMLAAVWSGLRWMWRHRAVRAIATVGTLMNFAANGFLITLVLNLQQRHVAPAMIGTLETGLAVGGLAGALVAPALLRRFCAGQLAIAAGWAVATLFGVMVMTHSPWVLVVLLALAIFLVPPLNSGLIGYQIAGVLLEHLGVASTLWTFVALVALAAAITTLNPALRAIPLLSDLTASRDAEASIVH